MLPRSLALAGLAVVATQLVAPGNARAQQIVNAGQDETVFALEMSFPLFTDELPLAFPTTAGFLVFRTPIQDRWSFRVDVPFASAKVDSDVPDLEDDDFLIGNPYLGVEWHKSERFTGELGVRIPTGDVDDDRFPLLTVPPAEVERMEAFFPEILGIYAIGDWTLPLEESLDLEIRGGPSLLTGDGTSDDLHLTYGALLWYDGGDARFGGGFNGRWNVTSDDEFEDDSIHQLLIGADALLGNLRPALQIRLPLDDEIEGIADVALAFGLGVVLN